MNPNEYLVLAESHAATGASRLAAYNIQCAFTENDTRWINDTKATHPFSLSWCCVALSLAVGYHIAPETVRDLYAAGANGKRWSFRRVPSGNFQKMSIEDERIENEKYRSRERRDRRRRRVASV